MSTNGPEDEWLRAHWDAKAQSDHAAARRAHCTPCGHFGPPAVTEPAPVLVCAQCGSAAIDLYYTEAHYQVAADFGYDMLALLGTEDCGALLLLARAGERRRRAYSESAMRPGAAGRVLREREDADIAELEALDALPDKLRKAVSA